MSLLNHVEVDAATTDRDHPCANVNFPAPAMTRMRWAPCILMVEEATHDVRGRVSDPYDRLIQLRVAEWLWACCEFVVPQGPPLLGVPADGLRKLERGLTGERGRAPAA